MTKTTIMTTIMTTITIGAKCNFAYGCRAAAMAALILLSEGKCPSEAQQLCLSSSANATRAKLRHSN
jgi:hypothetical protein